MTPEQEERCVYIAEDGTMWLACDPYPNWFRYGAHGETIEADWAGDRWGWVEKAGPRSWAYDEDGKLYHNTLFTLPRLPYDDRPKLIVIGLAGVQVY